MRTVALLVAGGLPLVALAERGGVPATYAENLKLTPQAQVCRAARALSSAQGDLASPKGTVLATWEWQKGTGVSAQNAAGVVATALARSLKDDDGCADRAAVARFARARTQQHAAHEILFDADVEALAASSEALSDASLARVAAEAFERRYGGASGQEIVERWFAFKRDPALIGYDAALAIRAGLAVNDVAKARAIADAAIAAWPRWGESEDTKGFLTTSRGALLEALARLDAKRYRRAIRDLVHHLVLTQSPDGSWETRNTQSTAYAVVGLAASGQQEAQPATERGRRWLRLTQLREGTWATFNDLVPEPFVGEVIHEVTAEAMMAVAAR